jgi:hypothetical protein
VQCKKGWELGGQKVGDCPFVAKIVKTCDCRVVATT